MSSTYAWTVTDGALFPSRLDDAPYELRKNVESECRHRMDGRYRDQGEALWDNHGSTYEKLNSACHFLNKEYTNVLCRLLEENCDLEDIESAYISIITDPFTTAQEKTITWQDYMGGKLESIQRRMGIHRPELFTECFEDASRLWYAEAAERNAGMSTLAPPPFTLSTAIGIAQRKWDKIPDQSGMQRSREFTADIISHYEGYIRKLQDPSSILSRYANRYIDLPRCEYELDKHRAAWHLYDQLEIVPQEPDWIEVHAMDNEDLHGYAYDSASDDDW